MRTKEAQFSNWTYTCDICQESIVIEHPPIHGIIKLLPDWEELTFCRQVIAHICSKQECKEKAKVCFAKHYEQ